MCWEVIEGFFKERLLSSAKIYSIDLPDGVLHVDWLAVKEVNTLSLFRTGQVLRVPLDFPEWEGLLLIEFEDLSKSYN